MIKTLTLGLLVISSMAVHAQNVVQAPLPEDSINTFTKVDVPASVDRTKWVNHLTSSLNTVVDSAAKVLKAGRYSVQVRFIVEKDGTISHVEALNEPGFGIGQLAADVVRRGPKWKPAKIGKRAVRSYYTQPVIFVLAE